MSVDPSSLVVTLGAAVGALVLGVAPQVEVEQAAAVSHTVQERAGRLLEGVSAAIDSLPPGAQASAEQVVTETSERLQAEIEALLPEDAVSPDEGVGESGVGETGSDAKQVGTIEPTYSTAVTPMLPPAPSISPFTSTAPDVPIGAVAVFAPWLKKAGTICDGITAPVLAALYSVENGFRYGPEAPVSPAGALGPGQFMPGTWEIYGKDADGDGKADVFGIADPVMASGRLLCDDWNLIEQWKKDGRVVGDTLSLTLAAYNAGRGAVLRSGGMPSGLPDYEIETKPYVGKILAARPAFERMLSPFMALEIPAQASDLGQQVIEQAFRYLGLPYVWGGGNIQGPTGGGFDCSGLTSFALHAAAGIVLPRTSETQWHVGIEVPLDQAHAGDLVFGNWQTGGPGHVGIYLGEGLMVHAPTTGDVVRIGEVFPDMRARRIV
ncbi:bifunctional lytic transglycosylase/C40 family peptidase [Rhodococcus rhodochrous]|uniref:Bifunctional lytic transglycosylase/C40 family peptidase n=1 Tax=Rhodococcus rhodochrous TaxID=1829 RepID=A0AAW4XES1_RHORH|nr:bifunctional lytic transglycosylase/C40 family peptidase [Rhodococcus rhodochrous]MCD2111620.1 bifunctional lytic transglycosylase/C40 family peptidase [Rhodococcus rhodochrous]